MLLMFVATALLALIFGTLAILAASEPTTFVKPEPRLRARPIVVIRPDPANVRPTPAPPRTYVPTRNHRTL